MTERDKVVPTSYRRWNPLRDQYGLVSPHRLSRTWGGQTEKIEEPTVQDYEPNCYICPGNKRVGDKVNPQYTDTFVFGNDTPAFLATIVETSPKSLETTSHNLFREEKETGVCEVISYSPKHNKTMANMSVRGIEKVVGLWRERFIEIGSRQDINHVLIFETRGREMGSSNSHPHGQIWAQEHVPNIPAVENDKQRKYFDETGRNMLLDYVDQEIAKDERVVYVNEDFVVLVPYWVEWPYETMVLPRSRISGIDELNNDQAASLAKSLALVTRTYASLFERPKYGASYLMGIHQKPTDKKDHPELQMHIHFQVPYLTPSRFKFQAGYEKFGEKQRDMTAEQAAQRLRECAQALGTTL